MQLDDATLFLSKYTSYPDDLELYNLFPILYLEYQKECLENKVDPFNMQDFYDMMAIWFNQNILIKN